jgi:S-DNA-T family DNA segregation ATPase FtsK/SpoIIIE
MGRRRRRQATFAETMNWSPLLTRVLLGIFLLIIASIAALAFFQLAGPVGAYIDPLLALTFGEVRYVFPIILIIVALLIIRESPYEYRPTHFIGCVLFFLSFNGLIHLQHPSYELAMTGHGGGLVGYALSYPLNTYLGYWGATCVLVGILVASVVFILNASLAHIINLHKKIFLGLGWLGQGLLGFFAMFKREPHSEALRVQGEHADEEETEEEEIEEKNKKKLFKQTPIKEQEEFEKEEENAEELPDEVPVRETIQVARPKRNYKLPGVDLLFTSKGKPTSGDIKSNAKTIEETFKNFGIEVEMGEIRVGPTVTQFSLKPAKGIKLTRITALQNDLSLALAAHPLRIEAPIPGQALVGIEVPNQKVAMVTLRELLESTEYKQRSHSMMVPLGKDVAGKVWLADLPKMPHLLIAGATGSGKTVGINTLILSLLYQNTPDTLRFIMVDPKRVELTLYNGIPHLLTPVITDAAKTVNALKWTIGEMERRFDTLAASGKRDISSYNKTAAEPIPYLVFVIDELADLMAVAGKEVEAGIIRIAQMARAVGIHLVVATQRPSVEVITGLMKANIPARMAFSVASIIDSRTILDCPGAEKLLGRGDMLFLTADLSKPKRIQGAFVSEEEMKHVVDFLKGDEAPVYDESIVSKNNATGMASAVASFGGSDNDPMFEEAKQIIIESGKASASLLQRRMKVGYARAARLLDELEEAGVVGPADGAKPREVFTEHLRPQTEEEIPIEEQSLGTGGAVFDETSP